MHPFSIKIYMNINSSVEFNSKTNWCPDLMSEIPETSQKVDCPPSNFIILIFYVTIRFSVKMYKYALIIW